MKYVYRGQRNTPLASSDNTRFKYLIVIAILAVALIVTLSFLLFGAKDISEEKINTTIKTIINTEMKNAITQSENLSRSGASGTSNTLGKVRQHVYALETLNKLNIQLFGQSGRLYPQQYFDTTQGIIESYATMLQTGQPTNEVLAKLIENLKIIQSATTELVGN
ncbi:MAG: hypothetical protein GYA87_00520 [Christensenellaceae bacterium]|nr:hypothetical protein [Christensenellaceae bacterium]